MKKIFVAGHRGMVGAAIVKKLKERSDCYIVTKSREELDLTRQSDVLKFFSQNSFDEVYLAAAKVGGIHANNSYPADFIYKNLMIEANIINAAYETGVKKLLFLGSSCIYPKLAIQPMKEDALLTGKLEETNEPYAIAKIAGIKLCESYNRQYGCDFRSVMPTNLYGPNDNFHPENSHVIPALLRRFHESAMRGDKEVVAWGSGKPMREFLHVDDMADACVYVMNVDKSVYEQHTEVMNSHVNIGTGKDCSIKELVETVARVTGFHGDIIWDSSKPDGAPRKLMDVSCIQSMGWKYSYDLEEGLKATYKWFLDHQYNYREN